jgi:predicted AlkP superfamily pyrophosphatase or phosphodiesterase
MSRRLVLLLLLLLCLWASGGAAHAPTGGQAPTVILISFDGWRWDYAQKYSAPNVSRLMAGGVSASLIPSFPSKTFPNHYTIVTGL